MTTWTSFGEGLAHDLARLPAGALVVIAETSSPGRYVQFVQSDDSLHAELIGEGYLDADHKLSPEQRRIIEECGWYDPAANPEGTENWWVDLPWPIPSGIYRQLASMVVTGLRDAMGMDSPALMTYDAWDARHGNQPLHMPRLGIARKRK